MTFRFHLARSQAMANRNSLIVWLGASGYTVSEIAPVFGLSTQRIREILKNPHFSTTPL